MSDTVQYPNWFDALGNPLPAGNRERAYQLLKEWEIGRELAFNTVERVANLVEDDKPYEALTMMRILLDYDETGVIMFFTQLCCPSMVLA